MRVAEVKTGMRQSKIEGGDITQAEIDAVMNQERRDPLCIAFIGTRDTCKSGCLAEVIANLPDGKVGVVLDFDHSLLQIVNTHYSGEKDKFLVVNATGCEEDYRRGLKAAMRGISQYVEGNGDAVGLFAIEGSDELLRRSFRMALQSKGREPHEIKFFGRKDEEGLTPHDWYVRNDFNMNPFVTLYNLAAKCGVNLYLTTHTKPEMNEKREILKADVPVWYKHFEDYVDYLFIMRRVEGSAEVKRIGKVDKSRLHPELYGSTIDVMVQERKGGGVTFHGLRAWMIEKGVIE